jgi:hypothetical protein
MPEIEIPHHQVMIAFTGKGSTLDVWGNSQVNLTSPISPPQPGIWRGC